MKGVLAMTDSNNTLVDRKKSKVDALTINVGEGEGDSASCVNVLADPS